MSLNELRVRLEGRLEVLEAAASHLESLEVLLREGAWADAGGKRALGALRGWLEVAPRIEDAVAAARRADAADALARWSTARTRLSGAIAEHLARTAVVRFDALEPQLEAWAEIVETTASPPRALRVLGDVSVKVRSPAWIALLALAGGMLSLSQPLPALVLLIVARAAFGWIQQTRRYWLFPDAVRVEREGEPTIELELSSLERTEVRPGMTLRGNIELALPATDQLRPFCALVNRVIAEREVLVAEQKALAGVSGPAGAWVSGVWSPAEDDGPEAVEVLKFEKHDRPVQLVAGSGQEPINGSTLVLENGLLFVPRRAESSVRECLFGTGWIDLLTEERVPLSTMPQGLFVDRLDALRRVPGVLWFADVRMEEGPEQRVVLADGVLLLER